MASHPVDTSFVGQLPFDVQLPIMQNLAYKYMLDLLQLWWPQKETCLQFLDMVRSHNAVIAGGFLHCAWHGGYMDCDGWAHRISEDIDIWIDCDDDHIVEEEDEEEEEEVAVVEEDIDTSSSDGDALELSDNVYRPMVKVMKSSRAYRKTPARLTRGEETSDGVFIVDSKFVENLRRIAKQSLSSYARGYNDIDWGQGGQVHSGGANNLGVVSTYNFCTAANRSIQVHLFRLSALKRAYNGSDEMFSEVFRVQPGPVRLVHCLKHLIFDYVPLGFLTYSKLNAFNEVGFDTRGICTSKVGFDILCKKILWLRTQRAHSLLRRDDGWQKYGRGLFPCRSETEADLYAFLDRSSSPWHRDVKKYATTGTRFSKYNARGYRILDIYKGQLWHPYRICDDPSLHKWEKIFVYPRAREPDSFVPTDAVLLMSYLPSSIITRLVKAFESLVQQRPRHMAELLERVIAKLDPGIYSMDLQRISLSPTNHSIYIDLPDPYGYLGLSTRYASPSWVWHIEMLSTQFRPIDLYIQEDPSVIKDNGYYHRANAFAQCLDVLFPQTISIVHKLALIAQRDTHWTPSGVRYECHCNHVHSDVVVRRVQEDTETTHKSDPMSI